MSAVNNAHSMLISALRLGRGLFVTPGTRQPEELLHLHEFEACPFCRKVREVLCELDLAFVCHPCARGSNNRNEVIERGGKALFPFLVDPNADVAMYESEDIITHLLERYGAGRRTVGRLLAPLNTVGATVASGLRPRGRRTREPAASRTQPHELLELYNIEASPYCRKVREALHELNLDHLVHNVGKGSARRPQLVARGGRMMVPYLVDPNTDAAMYESDDIVRYLHATYG